MSKSSDCWLTPNTPKHPVLDLVTAVLGEIDLDPCSNSFGAPNVPAKHHYRETETGYSGLITPWHGRIFMNPPYSKPCYWVERFCYSYVKGDMEAGIALLKSGVIHNGGTGAVIRNHASAVCFWGAGMSSRIQFLDPTTRQPVGAPNFDCVLVYCGPDVGTFSAVFSGYGVVMQTLH
jgi:hypothetical protein